MRCGPDDITCAINRLTAAVQAEGPSWVDWLGLLFSLLAVGATFYLGRQANKSSKEAVRIAKQAYDAETARDAAAYESALTQSLFNVFESSADYVAQVARFTRSSITRPAEEPSPARLGAIIEAARLIAKDEDRAALAALSDHWMVIRDGAIVRQSDRLSALLDMTREWREGSLSVADYKKALLAERGAWKARKKPASEK